MRDMITNLVFEGGGAKGSAYAGCVEVLEDLGIYDSVQRVAGTSAGAITASLLATGAGSTGLTESVHHSNFKDFVADRWGLVGDTVRFVEEYGIHTGNEFTEILKDYFKRFAGDSEITFAALEELVKKSPQKYKSLSVVASNITHGRPQIFNAENHPDLPIWHAVRASISLPLIFEPVKIDDAYHVDGGLAWNYPIDIYDAMPSQRNPKTLGFYLEAENLVSQGKRFNPSTIEINSIQSYAMGLTAFMYQAANRVHIHPDDKSRTVFVDDLGVSATDFSITPEKIDALVESGRVATRTYFSSQ